MKRLLIPALLALAFQSTSVFAANNSSAEASIDWNAMTFTLFDLNPADGQLPSVVWSGQYGDTSASASGNDGIHSSSISESYRALSATSVVGSNAVTAYSTSTSTYNNQSLAIAASADASFIPVGSSYVNSNASASGSLHSAFSLSGAGVMVISVPYTIKVTGDQGSYWENYSHASMSIDGYYSASDGSYSGSGHAAKSFYSFSEGDQVYSGIFTLSVANSNGLLTTSGYFDSSLSAFANANPYVLGVPEPETYAMMLAGLGLVGTMARRRTSKSA
jgi:hypothetical protein